MRSGGGGPVPQREALLQALRKLKDPCLQRFLAAGAAPADAERLMANAIEELQRTERPLVFVPDFARRFLRAVDRQCQTFAELRGLPYRTLEPLICRHWNALLEHSRRVGIERETALRVICDLIRKHGASWAATKNPGEVLLAQLIHGLHAIGWMQVNDSVPAGNVRREETPACREGCPGSTWPGTGSM